MTLGSVIMLSGPVGAGKSTVATLLLPLLRKPVSLIDGDRFWTFFAHAEDDNRGDHFKLVMRSMTAACIPFARSGYNVVLDFSIPPMFLPTAQKILKEVPLDYVVLRPPESMCAMRASQRKDGCIDDYAPYRDLYAMFQQSDDYVLQDEHADAASLATQIAEGLSAGWFRVD